jgi:hypothetical protein
MRAGGHVAQTADLIQGTAHGQPASIEDVRINHRGLHVLMPQEFLHCPDIIALLEQMRRKAMP